MNYGALGFIIGHELTHAYDDEQRQYDDDKYQWLNITDEKFNEKIQCIIKQYDNYTAEDLHVKVKKKLNNCNLMKIN